MMVCPGVCGTYSIETVGPLCLAYGIGAED